MTFTVTAIVRRHGLTTDSALAILAGLLSGSGGHWEVGRSGGTAGLQRHSGPPGGHYFGLVPPVLLRAPHLTHLLPHIAQRMLGLSLSSFHSIVSR